MGDNAHLLSVLRRQAEVYVNASAPGPFFDGKTCDTALDTIQTGVNAVSKGGIVRICGNDTYKEEVRPFDNQVIVGLNAAESGGDLDKLCDPDRSNLPTLTWQPLPTGGPGIVLSERKGVTIAGLRVLDCLHGGALVDKCEDITFSSCVFEATRRSEAEPCSFVNPRTSNSRTAASSRTRRSIRRRAEP